MPTIYNKVELDGTTLLDLSQDTASSASHIRQGYTAHLNDGTQVTGTYSGGTPTIQSLTVNPSTTQQTFNASGVDGYKPVTVSAVSQTNLTADNIKNGTTVTISNGTSNLWSVTGTYSGGGGATNFVTGTFTTGSSTGVGSLSIPYTGSGYPIMAVVVVEGGAYNSGVSEWYDLVQRYAVGQWTMTKSVFTSAPTYGTSGAANQGVVTSIYKSSTSSPTTYTRGSAMNTNIYTTYDATNASTSCVRLKAGNVLSYYVNTSSYGLAPNITYRYFIVYSS